MSNLAKRYKFSDVALAKICRTLLVPVSPRGYWPRVERGYNATRPNLPKMHKGQAETAKMVSILFRSGELPDEGSADSVARAIKIRWLSGIQTFSVTSGRIIKINEPSGSQGSNLKGGPR